MADEKKTPPPPSQPPVIDTGVAGNVPAMTGRENPRPLSELPPVVVPEGVKNILQVERLPSDEIPMETIGAEPQKVEPSQFAEPGASEKETTEPPEEDDPKIISFEDVKRVRSGGLSMPSLIGDEVQKVDAIVPLSHLEIKKEEREAA